MLNYTIDRSLAMIAAVVKATVEQSSAARISQSLTNRSVNDELSMISKTNLGEVSDQDGVRPPSEVFRRAPQRSEGIRGHSSRGGCICGENF